MSIGNVIRILRPNVTSLGYALFLAINAAGVWGGVFPFLPMGFQTPDIIFSFFLSQSLVFMAVYVLSAVGVYFFPGPTRRFLVLVASVPYFLGWCCLLTAMYFDELALLLVIAGGCLIGLGTAGFFMMWQRLFASQDADRGTHDLVLGTIYAAVIYFSLYLIPTAVTVLLIPLVFLPLFGLCISIKSRTIDANQPMFEDVPRKHPRIYRQVLQDYWRSALSVGAIGFCCGIMRALAIANPQVGSLVNILSLCASFVAGLLVLFLWQYKNVRLNIPSVYRLVFPFVISAFLLLPFFGDTFLRGMASILYALYSCAIVLMMIQCAQASRDRGINPVFIYGFFGGIVYALHDFGFISGLALESIPFVGATPLIVVSLFAVYLLGLMYFIGQGGFRQVFTARQKEAEQIELVAINRPGKVFRAGMKAPGKGPALAPTGGTQATTLNPAAGPEGRGFPAASKPVPSLESEPQYKDRISKQCAVLQQHYRLTAREAEVMELIARGNSVSRIAEDLVVSENTIRTHSKRIYVKLDIHKRQELLDLIEQFSPEDIVA